jgi:hypothetical protein
MNFMQRGLHKIKHLFNVQFKKKSHVSEKKNPEEFSFYATISFSLILYE